MAGPRILDSERLTLSELYFEVLYSTLRLRHAPETKALVAEADKKLVEVDARLKQPLRPIRHCPRSPAGWFPGGSLTD